MTSMESATSDTTAFQPYVDRLRDLWEDTGDGNLYRLSEGRDPEGDGDTKLGPGKGRRGEFMSHGDVQEHGRHEGVRDVVRTQP